MQCKKCGMELRPGARFCRICGLKVPLRNEPDKREGKDVAILPIADKSSSQKQSSDFGSIALPPLAQTLRETVPLRGEANQSLTEDVRRESEGKPFFTEETVPLRGEANQSLTENLRRESEAKPFFTQEIEAGFNRQHIRMIALVPVLLLLVILLFVFAFIAAR